MRVIAGSAGAAMTVFAIFGILQRTAFPSWRLANLDSELSVATFFAATLLWAAAAGWLLVALAAQPPARSVWVWWLALAWLAIDEGNAIHERVEKWSGVDWQILYLPILAVAGMAWWGMLRRYRNQERIDRLLLAGAAAWAVTLILELVEFWGGEPAVASIYNPAMITEELLEMTGSTVFFIAAVLALRVATRPDRSLAS